MRIALVAQEYPPETAKGGIGSQTYAKAHGLAALGHEVHVISRTLSQDRQERRDGLVTLWRVPGLSERMAIHTEIADWLTYSAEVAAAIADLHQQTPLDIIDFPEWGAEGYVHLLNRTQWNSVPTVIHLHGPLVMFAHAMDWPDIDSEFYCVGTHMEGTCLRLADAVFSSSACSADWCARHYGLKREEIPVIHTGLDTNVFQPQDVPKEARPTVVFAGKLVANKGVFELLEAACQVAADFPGLRLRMIGKGEPQVVEALQLRAAALGPSDLLDLTGFVQREDLPTQLSRAHLFAAPSHYEAGPGFVNLEAMACGLPVICTEGSGAAEVVVPGQNGFLVPPRDVDALAAALRRLLSDADNCQQMGRDARRFVLDRADSRVCLREIETFYLSVVKRQQVKSQQVTQ